MLLLYNSLMWSYLEYALWLWSPSQAKHPAKLDDKGMATMLTYSCIKSYDERLPDLRVLSLEKLCRIGK